MSKDTFVAYIDFMKCFDLIDRNLLFYKLTEYGIDGKLYRTLKMMYTNTMSAVNINNSLSDWFYTENGCRQGDVTSPTAFSILINDLLKELKASNIGIPVENLVIPVLAFADDIALLAENESDLQKLINIVHKWSCKWRFIINPEKSQIVHYRNPPKVRSSRVFKLYDKGPTLEIVDCYKYLGVHLDEYLTFSRVTSTLSAAGSRALGGMITKYKQVKDLGFKTYTKLFHTLVCPILDYGSEVFGFKSFKCMDDVQNRAIRFFTGVHKYAPIQGYIGDMGWIPCKIRWKINRIRFWNRLINTDNSRMLKTVFKWDMKCHSLNNKSNFSSHVKQILCDINLKTSYDRCNQVDLTYVKQELMNKHNTEWKIGLTKYKKLHTYDKIKPSYDTEKYLLLNLDKYERSLLSQLRYRILPLRIETGCYQGEEECNRICKLCNTNNVETVQHFLFDCDLYVNERTEFSNLINSQAAGGSNIGQGHGGVYQACLCILLLPTSGAIFQVVYESQIC